MLTKRLVVYYAGAALLLGLVFAIAGSLNMAAGSLLGLAISFVNFMLLEKSVRKLVVPSAGSSGLSKTAFMTRYFAVSFLKLLLTALVFFAAIVWLKFHWLGLLSGLFLGMFLYTILILRRN